MNNTLEWKKQLQKNEVINRVDEPYFAYHLREPIIVEFRRNYLAEKNDIQFEARKLLLEDLYTILKNDSLSDDLKALKIVDLFNITIIFPKIIEWQGIVDA